MTRVQQNTKSFGFGGILQSIQITVCPYKQKLLVLPSNLASFYVLRCWYWWGHYLQPSRREWRRSNGIVRDCSCQMYSPQPTAKPAQITFNLLSLDISIYNIIFPYRAPASSQNSLLRYLSMSKPLPTEN